MSFPWSKIDGVAAEDDLWMLFHENSKSSRYEPAPPDDTLIATVLNFWDVLPYEGYEQMPLPADLAPLDRGLSDLILERSAGQSLSPDPITLTQLATLLHCAYGITRVHDKGLPKPLLAPSVGGPHPLELYLHAAHVESLAAGLYHFNLRERRMDLVQPGDCSRQIAAALKQPELGLNMSLMIFITAVFERVIVKHGDRGYRFALLDAGHIAQNINLAAAALDLCSVNIGAFLDREIDHLIGLDGIAHSTLYLVGVGKNLSEAEQPAL